MEILKFVEFILGIAINYGIPAVKKVMVMWDVDKPTLDQIRELKNIPRPEEYFK